MTQAGSHQQQALLGSATTASVGILCRFVQHRGSKWLREDMPANDSGAAHQPHAQMSTWNGRGN